MQTDQQKKKDVLAQKMAVYFEERVTASKLCRWVGIVNGYLFDYPKMESHAPELTGFITWSILPQLIECKNKSERLKVLAEQLPEMYGSVCIDNAKQGLRDVGEGYLKAFVKYNPLGEEVIDFMEIFTVLLYLCEDYSEYEFIQKQIFEEKRKAA